MAARNPASTAHTLDLRQVRAEDLEPILSEEVTAWWRFLDWDFTASADLVRRFVGMQALNGYALIVDGSTAGYSYYVIEDRKGLIGDLYIQDRFASTEHIEALLSATYQGLATLPGVRRVETQLMLLPWPARHAMPGVEHSSLYERCFMVAALHPPERFVPGRAATRLRFDTWSEHYHEDAATTISAAYRDHIDSRINDQYRSAGGARRFLMNIVQYPGCGVFFQPASFVALDPDSRRMVGISLASLVAAEVGHITQICVIPSHQGTGAGYELLRRSLAALYAQGCRKVSLTVTASNARAIQLYQGMGFSVQRRFGAYVWDGL